MSNAPSKSRSSAAGVSEGPGFQKEFRAVDCDVHPMLPDGTRSLLPYIAENWRERLASRDMSRAKSAGSLYTTPNPTNRVDATPPSGGPPASDPAFVVKDLLDRFNLAGTILLPYQAGGLSGWADGREAAVWAEAFNRYFIDTWLPVDGRYRLAVIVAPHDPGKAVAEIRRCASIPGVGAVWLPMRNILLGNSYHDPIYAAATEAGLPIVLHTGGATFSAPRAVGVASTFAENYGSLAAGGLAINNLSSLIFEGTFESFPTLKVVFIELGWTWVGPAMWRMDRSWKSLRVQVPWVKRPPSDYVIEHCRFTTEPVDEPQPSEQLLQVAMMAHGERTLLFSTDYPHWDGDVPSLVFGGFPADLRRRIFYENAVDTFGDRIPAPTAVGA